MLTGSKAVLNHEKVVSTLANAISQIAEALPHVEIRSIIYPTQRMEAAVTDLYASILKFLVRARDWYEEGRFKHFLHSITRPVELRYNDLLQDIAENSNLIRQIAELGHQAESRDVHGVVQEINSAVNGKFDVQLQYNDEF